MERLFLYRIQRLDAVMRTLKPGIGVVLAVAGLALATGAAGAASAGSGNHSTAFGQAIPPGDPFQPPDSPVVIDYADGLVSYPLPSAQANPVAITASAALQIAASLGSFGDGLQPGAPSVTLRMITATGIPDQSATAGIAASSGAPRPGWVLIWSGSRPVVMGPGSLSDSDRALFAQKMTCIFVVAIDANSGLAMDSHQVCAQTG